MGVLILCQEKKADVPFFISCIGKNVFCMEELCFFFYHELYFVEEFEERKELTSWLAEELHESELAQALKALITREDMRITFAVTLLRFVQYRPEAELDEYERTLYKMHNSSRLHRQKKRADYLVVNKKYNQAMDSYRELLEQTDEIKSDERAQILHNLGVCYGRMFYFEKAADCFLQSFSLVPTKESLKQYKLAVRLSENQVEDEDAILNLPSVQQLDQLLDYELETIEEQQNEKLTRLEQLEELKKQGRIQEYYEQLNQLLHEWKEECRGYMY